MSDQGSKDAESKQRIISHMNADHHDSVIRYLEVYHKVSAWAAYSGKITDITLSELTMTCDDGTFKTKLDPPMSSLKEARERLVAMDKECVILLDRSDITVRGWTFPQGRALVIEIMLLVTYLEFSRRANFAPDGILSFLPDAIRTFCYNAQPKVFYGLLGVHLLETSAIMRKRLRKHNVNARPPLYWLWSAECMLSGIVSLKRFDLEVHRQQKAKDAAKH